MTLFVFCTRAASADLGMRDTGRQQLYLANRPPLVSAFSPPLACPPLERLSEPFHSRFWNQLARCCTVKENQTGRKLRITRCLWARGGPLLRSQVLACFFFFWRFSRHILHEYEYDVWHTLGSHLTYLPFGTSEGESFCINCFSFLVLPFK